MFFTLFWIRCQFYYVASQQAVQAKSRWVHLSRWFPGLPLSNKFRYSYLKTSTGLLNWVKKFRDETLVILTENIHMFHESRQHSAEVWIFPHFLTNKHTTWNTKRKNSTESVRTGRSAAPRQRRCRDVESASMEQAAAPAGESAGDEVEWRLLPKYCV